MFGFSVQGPVRMVRAASLIVWLIGALVLPTRAASPRTPDSTGQLAIWTFDDNSAFADGTPLSPTAAAVNGSPTLTMFNADIDDNGKEGRIYSDILGIAHPAGRAAAWDDIRKNDAPDAVLMVQIDTTDWYDISLRFDYKSDSATGYNLDYSTDGGSTWEAIRVQASMADGYAWQTEVVDLTGWDAIENQGDLRLRVDHLDDTGNDRFVVDNVELYGTGNADPNRPTIKVASTTTQYLRLPETGSGQISGVVDDPTDPAGLYGIDFLLTDPDTALESLEFSATVTDTAVIPASGLTWTGSGANRNLTIRPVAAGLRTITVTVSDGDSSSTYLIQYAASAAAANPAGTRFHTGMSDASSAIAVDGNVMLIANDELINGLDMIYVFDRTRSGALLQAFDFTERLDLGAREMDLEASAQVGDTVYWLSSLGNNKDGECRADRHRFFGTQLSGSGVDTTLAYAGHYDYLRADLIAWDQNNEHGRGADHYGLAASASCIPDDNEGIEPKRIDGFNIEGLAVAPDGSTGFIAFRAPISPAHARTKALIVPLTNMTSLLDSQNGGTPGSAQFGDPIELDLGGRGIRSMARNAAGDYLIIAGTVNDVNDFRLYRWTGEAADQPVELVDLTALNVAGSWEGIVEVPSPLGGQVQLLLDNGTTDWYANGKESKALAPNHQKFRSQWVALPNTNGESHKLYVPLLRKDPPADGATLVATGAVWRYLDDGTDQGTAWQQVDFDDSGWAAGRAQLGYGDGDEATVVSYGGDPQNKHITTYFRHTFTVLNPAAFAALELRLLRDDGAVTYLNGVEVARSNMPAGPISSQTPADGNADESAFYSYAVGAALLRAGKNVVAVEIHQVTATSSDISFDLSLARSATSAGIRFAVIGDYGMDDGNEQKVANLVNGWAPDFIITLGDNRYGNRSYDQVIGKYYCAYLKDLGDSGNGASCPDGTAAVNRFFPATGNHDYSDGGQIAQYLGYFANLPGAGVQSSNTADSRLYYDFVQGPVQFFVIDSQGVRQDPASAAAQGQWLESALTASTTPWQLVYFHHPPYSSGDHRDNAFMQTWPLAAWGVDGVLAGHDHNYERILRNGIVYFINGSGGAGLRDVKFPLVEGSVTYNDSDHGAMLVIADTCQLRFRFITVGGVEEDSHTVNGC